MRKETFDNVSQAFDATRMIQDCAIEEFWDFIFKNCILPSNPEILDIGCGTGKVLFPTLMKEQLSLVGMDKSNEMLEIAKAKYKDNYRNMKSKLFLLNGDALALPFKDNYFDLIITTNVIHLVKEWQQFLKEVDRCLLEKNKQFISAKVFTDVHATEPFSVYWEKLAELGQHRTYLAVADFSPHQDFMKAMGYKQIDHFYKEEVQVDPSIFIYILENRCYSSLWKVDYNKHLIAVEEVKKWFDDHKGLTEIDTTANVELQYYTCIK